MEHGPDLSKLLFLLSTRCERRGLFTRRGRADLEFLVIDQSKAVCRDVFSAALTSKCVTTDSERAFAGRS